MAFTTTTQPTQMELPLEANEALILVYKISNGLILRLNYRADYTTTPTNYIYCEDERAVGEAIIAHAARKKMELQPQTTTTYASSFYAEEYAQESLK